MTIDTDRLRELLGKATDGPWNSEINRINNIEIWATRNGDDDKYIIGVALFGTLDTRKANAALIALTPTLAAEVLRLRERETKLVEALRHFIAMTDDAMSASGALGDEVYAPGVTDVELRPGGGYMLSQARTALGDTQS